MGATFSNPTYDVVVSGLQYSDEFLNSEKKTGWEGVKQVFSLHRSGFISPQLSVSITGTTIASLTGAVFGGIVHGSQAKEQFIRVNKATAFEDHFIARRKLQDKMILAFGSGALRWGFKLGVFAGTFFSCLTVIPAYRGKYSVVEWSVAGLFAGGTYKFFAGPKPMIAGAALGCLLGTVGGGLATSALYISGRTMDDIYYNEHMSTLRIHEKRLAHLKMKQEQKRITSDDGTL